jgi:hypothetical protein
VCYDCTDIYVGEIDFCLLIDVAIPSDRNGIQKEAEKKLKYKSYGIEIKKMWNIKCFVIPLFTEAIGIVTKEIKEYLEVTPCKH